jgi:hypothetical protein
VTALTLNGNGTELATYLATPSLVGELNPQQLASLIGQLEQLKALCWARLVSSPITPKETDKVEPGRMLKPAEAAQVLRRDVRWIYKHKDLPFVVRISKRTVVCDERRMLLWLKQHQS